jgi:hypothetical protein
MRHRGSTLIRRLPSDFSIPAEGFTASLELASYMEELRSWGNGCADVIHRGTIMKYARTERERRFLLQRLPDGLPVAYRRIRDWYLDGTRLRLRCVEDGDGNVLDLKLGQKYSVAALGAGVYGD